jgi:hypothetical protein
MNRNGVAPINIYENPQQYNSQNSDADNQRKSTKDNIKIENVPL